jgi:hypothetical protein
MAIVRIAAWHWPNTWFTRFAFAATVICLLFAGFDSANGQIPIRLRGVKPPETTEAEDAVARALNPAYLSFAAATLTNDQALLDSSLRTIEDISTRLGAPLAYARALLVAGRVTKDQARFVEGMRRCCAPPANDRDAEKAREFLKKEMLAADEEVNWFRNCIASAARQVPPVPCPAYTLLIEHYTSPGYDTYSNQCKFLSATIAACSTALTNVAATNALRETMSRSLDDLKYALIAQHNAVFNLEKMAQEITDYLSQYPDGRHAEELYYQMIRSLVYARQHRTKTPAGECFAAEYWVKKWQDQFGSKPQSRWGAKILEETKRSRR